MKIAILSRGPKLYSTRRLREAAIARGHKVRILDPTRFSVLVHEDEPDLLYAGKRVPHYEAVIPRIGASITFYGCAVVRQFEQMGVFCLSSANAISISRDKLRSVQVLSRQHLGLATTAFVRQPEDVLQAIEEVGGAPVVIKVLEGTQGIGVILADSKRIAQAIIETLQSARQNVLIQDFVAESRGRDIRAFVVGDHVVAAMRRHAQGEEFRSNIHRGGRTEAIELDEEHTRTAVRAARVLGLRVAGVDMLESQKGPKILEVNSSPGLEGIEHASGVDIADAVIELIEREVLFPEIDVRQRLTLSAGYGVIEIGVDAASELCDRTLREAELRDRDVLVLSIRRGSLVIPNPRGDERMLRGDVLLCYGKTQMLKDLARPQKRRRRRKRVPKIRLGKTG